MGMSDRELAAAKAKASEGGVRMDAPFKEFIPRLALFEERASSVGPDSSVTSDEALSGLALKAF